METLCNKHYKFEYKESIPNINIINPILENFRYKTYRKFEHEFIEFFMKKQIHKNIEPEKQRTKILKAFGRWIMLQIAFSANIDDPLIPSKLTKDSYIQLEEDIVNFTRDKTIDYKKLIDELNIQNLCDKHINSIKEFISNKHIKSFDKTIKININFDEKTNMYSLDCGESYRTVEISKLIHDRTKILFITNQSFSQNVNHEEVFYYLLYCLVLRYITLSEDGVRQGCKPQPFFDALYDTFNINFECFAASFAASSNHICSLFYDIERYFGSYGNFFDIKPIKGFYQVNPPLDSLITKMAMERVIELLDKNDNKEELGFICFIPTWDHETIKAKGYKGKLELYEDFPIYYELKKSKYLLMKYDIINKKILYIQYQGEFRVLGTYDSPHILVMGNDKFKDKFDKIKMEALLSTFIKHSF